MNVKMMISRSIGTRMGFSNIFFGKSYASDVKSAKLTEQTETGVLEYDEVPVFERKEATEEIINMKRNKSRLSLFHQNQLHGKKPYEESMEWYHNTVRYKRRMFGRYGLKALDAPAGIAWPTKEDVEDAKEYEQIAYPISLQESWKQIEEKKQADAEEIRLRELDIESKLANMNRWRTELANKMAKKEAAERAAKERKEKMIQEIRRHFGFNLHPRSPKFKELVEKREQESKQKKKKLTKEEKAAKLVEMLNRQFEKAETSAKKEKGVKASAEAKNEVSPEDKTPKDPKLDDSKLA